MPQSNGDAVREHEWRWFGLISYWYASLHVVVEGWDDLKFSDPIIDRLLQHPMQFRDLLRSYRNAVFHYKRSPFDDRFAVLLRHGVVLVCCIRALHDEFIRFYVEYLSSLMVTDEQRSELRKCFEDVLHWHPYRQGRAVDSLERSLRAARELLNKDPDDESTERANLERCLDDAERTLREGSQNWATLRTHLLREAGVR